MRLHRNGSTESYFSWHCSIAVSHNPSSQEHNLQPRTSSPGSEFSHSSQGHGSSHTADGEHKASRNSQPPVYEVFCHQLAASSLDCHFIVLGFSLFLH